MAIYRKSISFLRSSAKLLNEDGKEDEMNILYGTK